MAHLEYHNNMVDFNNLFYKSHCDLIRAICSELDQLDRVKEFEEKFLEKNKVKAKKDPEKPKKAKSSYMFFCQDMRITMANELSKLKIPDQSKKFSMLWKNTTDTDKDKYIKLADDDKVRYEEEMLNYNY